MNKLFFTFMIGIFFTLFLSSCGPVKMAQGTKISSVVKPSLSNTDQTAWMNYWTDQFRAYGTSVLPPDNSYNETARQSYQNVATTFSTNVHKATVKRSLVISGIAILPSIIYAGYALSQ
jgi:hypothetical protein